MPAVRGPVHSALALAAHKELRQWRGTPTLASGRRPSNRHYPSSTWGGRRPRRTRARPHGAPGHHAQAARRSGVPRVRHRRVQAGQVVAGQRPAERAGLPVDDDIATSVPTAIRFGDPPSAAVLFDPGGDLSDPDREPIREDIAVDRVASYVTEAADPAGERQVQLGRGVAAPQAAQRRPRHRRHPGRGRAGLGPQRRHDRRPADGRRRGVRLRRQPGVHRPRARVPADRPAHVPERRLRADQDRLLPRLAQDPRPRRRSPPAPRRARRDPVRVVVAAHPCPARQRPRAQPRVRLPAARQLPAEQIAANAERLSVRAAANDVVAVAAHARVAVPERAPGPRRPRPGPAGGRQPHRGQGQGRAAEERRVEVAADAERRRRRPAGRRRPRPARPPPAGDPPGRRGARGQRPGRDVGRVPGLALPAGGRGRRAQLHVPARPGAGADRPGRRALRRGRHRHHRRPRRRQPHRGADHASTPTPTSTCARWASARRAWPP